MVTVVQDPAAHLVNLRRAMPRPTHAIVACPMPPVCQRLAPECFGEQRRQALEAASRSVGGGDGAVPILDLSRTPKLIGGLCQLWEDGIRTVHVYGMAEQPGFAREITARWRGAVVDLAEDISAPLFEGPAVLWIAPGIIRLRPDTPTEQIPAGAKRVLAACLHGPHAADTQDERQWLSYAWDPARRLGVHAGCVPYEACVSDGYGLREAWGPQCRDAVLNDAVLGLDPCLEAALVSDAPATASLPARTFVITGTDGAGKSTHVARLADELTEQGASVAVVKLYRQGAFLELADEISGRVDRGAPMTAFRLSRVIKLVDSLRVLRDTLMPAAESFDALILDRWRETHEAAALSQLGWQLSNHPALSLYPTPDHAVWLTLPPEVALDRLADRDRLTADEHAAGIHGYAECFASLSFSDADMRLDARRPIEENAAAIASLATHTALRHRVAPRRETFVAAEPSLPMTTRCQVVVGQQETLPVLGGTVLSLRALADLTTAPLQFWLEAWASQCLLDLRTSRVEAACIPFWPAAAARAWPDLGALHEVALVLERETEVIGWNLLDTEYFAALGSEAGHRRLVNRYQAALRELAHSSGWEHVT